MYQCLVTEECRTDYAVDEQSYTLVKKHQKLSDISRVLGSSIGLENGAGRLEGWLRVCDFRFVHGLRTDHKHWRTFAGSWHPCFQHLYFLF